MATGFLLDGNGLSVKSYRETREALAAKIKGIFGEDLDLSPSSPDGQLIDLFCYAYNEVVEALQGAMANLDLESAEGVFLDNLGALMGIERNSDEDDDSYKSRLLNAETTGLATYDGMLTYLRKNIGSSVILTANEEPYEVDGLPGHTVSVYVPSTITDKTDNEIAQAIWDCKPAGIGTSGETSGTAVDKSGFAHMVYFSRITATDAYFMRITITEYTEELLPEDFDERIAEAVAEWAVDEYTPGKDIIPQRAVQAVYEIPGIDSVTVEVSADGETEWTSSRIPISGSKFAYFPKENITVSKAE